MAAAPPLVTAFAGWRGRLRRFDASGSLHGITRASAAKQPLQSAARRLCGATGIAFRSIRATPAVDERLRDANKSFKQRMGRWVWALPLLGPTGCAAMMEQWAATNCNYDAAYVEGMKTYDLGEELDLHRYGGCPAGSRPDTLKGFREGYARAQRSGAEARAQQQGFPGSAVSIHIGGRPTLAAGGRANDRKYSCSVEAFGREYSDFGPTRLEASQRAERRCLEDNHEIHCDEVNCRENR